MIATIELPHDKEIDIEFDKHVYDPRMSAVDTIVLADMCIKETEPRRIIDVACGSGVIGLALKKLNPLVDVVCSDISDRALKQTAKNSKRLGLKVTTVRADLLPKSQEFPVIVTNLPTFDSQQMDEVTLKGPKQAYDGGDGLDLYKKLVAQVPQHSFLICEVQAKRQPEFLEFIHGTYEIISRTDNSFALFRYL